ncbi:glycerol-3-phosphate acyltransferase [Clostridium sp. YIM B02515]|uniref:Glycerol-3-phosphate acyltransferase n=1 Tax=Clostridium rhizosphaerae TaxID=2803861 RepID=A0ABS1T7W8_9CLOT|nr:glycerol-3-phosphate acyltransferase [Clostridium rhizosphaerae]MBL4935443.1 glycerol-3-phosphate acyltransferase [Clostridium rhizosphaerae]
MDYFLILFLFVFSFLLGSIPTAYIVVKLFTGKDLRMIGSGNIGGTNGKRAGNSKIQSYLIYFCTGLGDILKGLLPVLVAMKLTKFINLPVNKDLIYVLSALLAITGHDTMPFMKNAKGKGVATTAGSLLLIEPVPVLVGAAVFALLNIFFKAASRRSIIASIAIVITCFCLNYSIIIKIGSVIACIFIVVRHKENIERILRGEE